MEKHESNEIPDDEEAAFDEPPLAIYTTPTVDTLDEGTYRPGPDISATDKPPEGRSVDMDEFSKPSHRDATPIRSSPPKKTTSKPKKTFVPPRPPATSPGKRRKSAPRDFQYPEDRMKVTARTIDLATRTAFAPIQPVSVQEWESIAVHASEVRSTNMQKRLSPSLQHLELLHKMNSITTIRQLAFSPSVGLESDVFVPWDEDLQDESTVRKRRRRSRSKRDGRYRSIDPFKAVADALPSHPPILSNRKYRLPMRSDVGFPNASEKEIIKKQQEIARETEWEEASPRLVVLVTSDDIGTAIHDDPPPVILLQHEQWNGGGLEGMALAGKELMMAKERNVRLSKRPRDGKNDFRKWTPDRTNMLAPPLEASYSSTLGWRPRPFNDLPPGMLHCLACPLNVQFDIGNIEPMVGSLALYCLSNDPTKKFQGAFGKISEEFYFPVGMWKGHVSLEAARTLKGTIDTDMVEAWHGRKHKGLFPYDPLAIPWSQGSLYLVLQVYKVPHSNALAPYLDSTASSALKKGKSISKRIKGTMGKRNKIGSSDDVLEDDADVGVAQSRANATFGTFRTQFLTPLCFAVAPLFSQNIVDAMAENVDEGIRSIDAASMNWPHGAVQDIQLYAVSSTAMSQEEFFRQVTTVAAEESGRFRSGSPNEVQHGRNTSTGDLSLIHEGTSEVVLDAMSTESSVSASQSGPSSSGVAHSHSDNSFPSKKSFLKRSSTRSTPSKIKQRAGGSVKVAGSATMFTSFIGNDFTQSLLNTPLELLDSGSERGIQALPRLLVDVTGDCAIMMNPNASKVSAVANAPGFETGRRRSDLVRLPLCSSPSGYADASEVRQVLYLPPRAEKQYDMDAPSSFRSCLNLLYMYPRLLRIAQDTNIKKSGSLRGQGKQGKEELVSYSMRIQLVKNTMGLDEVTGELESSQVILESFHNPVPWAGPQMLQAIYTKINDASTAKQVEHDLYSGGIPLRDEIKMRLPMVLDGTHFLQFTLFSIKFKDDQGSDAVASGVSIDYLAETTIPLSSSSNREPRSGVRVTTVIPNGCHRIRLGDYQLQLETRLVSSIHVCDPTLAVVLRDFPYAKDRRKERIEDKFKELALVPSRSVIGKTPSTDNDFDESLYFQQIFASSSESAIMGYFPVLVYMHLCNLVNMSTTALNLNQLMTEEILAAGKSGCETSLKFAMDNMNSLLEIFRKVKIKLGIRTGFRGSRSKADVFVKSFMDNFDEVSLLREQSERTGAQNSSDAYDGILSERSRSSLSMASPQKNSPSQYNNDVDNADTDDSDEEDNTSIVEVRRRNNKGQLKSSLTFNASGTPFSRVAFGASKTDRMRVEAELFRQSSHFTQLFDDDETIITSLHSLATPREETNGDFRRDGSDPLQGYILSTASEDSMISHSAKPIKDGSAGGGTGRDHYGLSESAFARRVRTAAQVIIAPCMTPSLSAVLSGSGNSPEGAVDREQHKLRVPPALKSRADASVADRIHPIEENREADRVNVYPGSDVDEETAFGDTKQLDIDEAVLRGTDNVRTLTFTIADSDEGNRNDPDAVPFIYEVVMALWLRSFVAQVDSSNKAHLDEPLGERVPGVRHAALLRVLSDDLNVSASAPYYMFHSQMDFLLPLCLKSFLLRCTSALPDSCQALLDQGHMRVLVPFVEMVTHGLIGEALAGPDDDAESALTLINALSSAQLVLDFLVGLASVLHPQQVAILLQKHFRILRECENPDDKVDFVWNKESLRRARCSRQLRLRSVERLSCMPNFVALNYPLKYGEEIIAPKRQTTTWSAQSIGHGDGGHYMTSVCPYPDGRDRLPRSGWLATLLAGESLSIASLSCEAVVAEAIAHVETSSPGKSWSPTKLSTSPSSGTRPGASLKRDDLLMFQSVSIHAVTCVYELLLRRHAMDVRFQKEQARIRIAALFAPVVIEKSLKSTRWLARMEATHKVRSTWLLCFIYVMQEAPESQLRDILQSYCFPPDFLIHRFIRVLRLSSATFQSFIEQPQHSPPESVLTEGLAPWLLQECFNTICASANMLVDECCAPISSFPKEEKKMTEGIFDLLLHVLTAPQSAVTYLRTIGGALHTLNKLGAENFLEAGGASTQHWLRIMLTLMNSTSLSVRSMAVDFMVSLLGATYNAKGNIDEIGIMLATILPEVVAREIALYSVNGLIRSIEDIERAAWPLRRGLADIEEANPLDDDRVDPFLSPLLSTLCRACQAIIDGVLIELRLTGNECTIVGSKVQMHDGDCYTFDADEESLYEAASFFVPETAPLQKLRWLFTLTRLHEAKGQWVEAAETLVLCARTACDAIPHIKSVWRPSRFVLWYDPRRSLWLSTVGKEMGHPDRGHEQVMQFADVFLEPPTLVPEAPGKSQSPKLPQPSIQDICNILTYATKQALPNYLKEVGMEELASSSLEVLLKTVMLVTDDHHAKTFSYPQKNKVAARKRVADEIAALRRVSTDLNGGLTKLAEHFVSDNGSSPRKSSLKSDFRRRQHYVRVILSGRKPHRFLESTTIPTFLEWNNPCICRVPQRIIESVVASGTRDSRSVEERIVKEFGGALRDSLLTGPDEDASLMFRTGTQVDDSADSFDMSTTFLDVSIVHMDLPSASGSRRDSVPASRQSRHFFYRRTSSFMSEPPPMGLDAGGKRPELLPESSASVVELTVAHPFPCTLSRQRTLVTSEILADNPNEL